MSEHSSTTDHTGASEDSSVERTPVDPPASESCTLEAKVVDYPDRADRCTIYPPGLTGIDRMEQWLTADTRAFVDLQTWR